MLLGRNCIGHEDVAPFLFAEVEIEFKVPKRSQIDFKEFIARRLTLRHELHSLVDLGKASNQL